jgi:hypothetical protein
VHTAVRQERKNRKKNDIDQPFSNNIHQLYNTIARVFSISDDTYACFLYRVHDQKRNTVKVSALDKMLSLEHRTCFDTFTRNATLLTNSDEATESFVLLLRVVEQATVLFNVG